MILTEVTKANAMCWPPFPVIRICTKIAAFIHVSLEPLEAFPEYTHQVGSSLSSSSSSFTARIRWPKLPIFFEYRLPTETAETARVAAGDSVKSSRLQRFDFGRWETSTRWRKCLVSLYVKHGKNTTTLVQPIFLLPFHDKMMK